MKRDSGAIYTIITQKSRESERETLSRRVVVIYVYILNLFPMIPGQPWGRWSVGGGEGGGQYTRTRACTGVGFYPCERC